MALHAQVMIGTLREQILSGHYAPGSRLPSIVALARRFGISAGMVRYGLAKLRDDGLITSVHGKGFFVADRLPEPHRRREQYLRREDDLGPLIGRKAPHVPGDGQFPPGGPGRFAAGQPVGRYGAADHGHLGPLIDEEEPAALPSVRRKEHHSRGQNGRQYFHLVHNNSPPGSGSL